MPEIAVDHVPAPGQVVRAGPYAVANVEGTLHAVDRLCRHQGGDLSRGRLDGQGCLVCPWHFAAYDLDDGKMVRGPKGFLWIRRRIPGYDHFVRAYARYLPLRRGRVERRGDRSVVV